MTVTTATYPSITEAQMIPRLVRLGPNLYGAVFTLMKLLPAHYILKRAEQRGELGAGTVVVETTSGTFGLALAMQCALMERPLILVSDPAIDPNLYRRLTDLGARVEICREPAPVGGYQEARLRRLAEIRAGLPDSFCPEQYTNEDNPRSYGVVAEMLHQTLGDVDCVIGPVGSGGSMCGTVRALRERTPHTLALGVDSHRSVLFGQADGPRGLRGLGNSLWPSNLDHTVFDEVHWCSAAEAYTQTRLLHARHALFQGPTSGAAHLVAQWWADRHPDRLGVVMLPDEGYRYQATVYDDSWLADNGLRLDALPAEPLTVASPAEAGEHWTRFAWARRAYDEVPGAVPRTGRPLPDRARS
ncbi:cysteine synthase family protein [Streptomyces pilosus]|uniref:Cystathionine beta-synthase n=1 Tax=Streptomyces pilosus TaxID=28893 RepID=A0A918BKQ8_9ACTN|nr:cysteine synthase family protein [Streptomyces pilosus]GGQ73688.1 cystathionine beta-synthase [Streptomyces pilosus]GGV58773.1 cystathionine beta-synthase [Streptomyces pilosus]